MAKERLEIVITADARKAMGGFRQIERGTKAIGEKTQAAGGISTRSLLAIGAAAGTAATAIGVKAVREAASFGRAMSEVSTITSLNEAQMKDLTERVKEMSSTMGVDATETARGLYQTISAGVTDADDAMKLMETATKGAVGGLTSQEVAVDALTTVMNAYGLSMDDVEGISDTLFTTVRLGKTRYDELANTIGRVVPIAATAGISFDEVGSALAAMTQQGLSTDIASTALRATLTSLLQPAEKVKKLAEETGVELGLQALKGKGLSGMLEVLNELYQKNEEAVVELFPNVRALTGVLALAGEGAEKYSMAMDEMGKKTGATNGAFEKMNKSSSRQFEMFKNRLNVVMIELGDAILPGVQRAMSGLEKSFPAITDLIKDNSSTWRDLGEAMGIATEAGIGFFAMLARGGAAMGKQIGGPMGESPVARAILPLVSLPALLTELTGRDIMEEAEKSEEFRRQLIARQGERERGAGRPGGPAGRTSVVYNLAPTYMDNRGPESRRLDPSEFQNRVTNRPRRSIAEMEAELVSRFKLQ